MCTVWISMSCKQTKQWKNDLKNIDGSKIPKSEIKIRPFDHKFYEKLVHFVSHMHYNGCQH